jgi:hypothetical protein
MPFSFLHLPAHKLSKLRRENRVKDKTLKMAKIMETNYLRRCNLYLGNSDQLCVELVPP